MISVEPAVLSRFGPGILSRLGPGILSRLGVVELTRGSFLVSEGRLAGSSSGQVDSAAFIVFLGSSAIGE